MVSSFSWFHICHGFTFVAVSAWSHLLGVKYLLVTSHARSTLEDEIFYPKSSDHPNGAEKGKLLQLRTSSHIFV